VALLFHKLCKTLSKPVRTSLASKWRRPNFYLIFDSCRENSQNIHDLYSSLYRVIKKEVCTLKNLFYKKILTLNPCLVYRWKRNLSKFWYRRS
jgi:hypothetical protein